MSGCYLLTCALGIERSSDGAGRAPQAEPGAPRPGGKAPLGGQKPARPDGRPLGAKPPLLGSAAGLPSLLAALRPYSMVTRSI